MTALPIQVVHRAEKLLGSKYHELDTLRMDAAASLLGWKANTETSFAGKELQWWRCADIRVREEEVTKLRLKTAEQGKTGTGQEKIFLYIVF